MTIRGAHYMEIKLYGTVSLEIKDFLLSQEGITDVEISYDKAFAKLKIELNKKINPNIVMGYIELYEKN